MWSKVLLGLILSVNVVFSALLISEANISKDKIYSGEKISLFVELISTSDEKNFILIHSNALSLDVNQSISIRKGERYTKEFEITIPEGVHPGIYKINLITFNDKKDVSLEIKELPISLKYEFKPGVLLENENCSLNVSIIAKSNIRNIELKLELPKDFKALTYLDFQASKLSSNQETSTTFGFSPMKSGTYTLILEMSFEDELGKHKQVKYIGTMVGQQTNLEIVLIIILIVLAGILILKRII
ncbi:MAG: hypothetical protein QW735_02505 [archaeon]